MPESGFVVSRTLTFRVIDEPLRVPDMAALSEDTVSFGADPLILESVNVPVKVP